MKQRANLTNLRTKTRYFVTPSAQFTAMFERGWWTEKTFRNESHVANTWSNCKIWRHSQYTSISVIIIDNISRYINSKYRSRKWRPPDLWAGTGARVGRSILHDATPTGRMGSVACNVYVREQWVGFDAKNWTESGTCGWQCYVTINWDVLWAAKWLLNDSEWLLGTSAVFHTRTRYTLTAAVIANV